MMKCKLIKKAQFNWTHMFVHVLTTALLLNPLEGLTQEKQLVQIKTFDVQLNPVKNIELSLNGGDFVTTGSKGDAYMEMLPGDLPPKSVTFKNEELEAASWNYSKGILEIIIRKKNFRLSQWTIKDLSSQPIKNLEISFAGKKTITVVSNVDGQFEIPLGLDENVTAVTQFSITGYRAVSFDRLGDENILIIDRIVPSPVTKTRTTKIALKDLVKNFDISKLDSIHSLAVFYAVFKNYPIKDMSEEAQQRVDAKFAQLVVQLQDSASNSTFLGRISDSSFVSEDVKNLLSQATKENQTLLRQRDEIDEKILLIREKLDGDLQQYGPGEREKLLSDLTLLEQLIVENEDRFYKNQNVYRQIINAIKDSFFAIKALENKLSESETQRAEEQRVFMQRLVAILIVVVIFAALIIRLITFSIKLRKQRKAMILVNNEINRINENLEDLILARTQSLRETNRELDTFLYRASHDLRSPVRSIIGLCSIAIPLTTGEPKELLEKVVYTTSGMDSLLKKLSFISEINHPSENAPIALLEMAEQVHQQFTKFIQDNRIEVVIDCPPDLVIYSHPALIHVIILNLVENALLYSLLGNSGHPRVEFMTALKGNHLMLMINDNGSGVSEAIAPKIFDMFFKGTEYSKGNGLGLYIVNKAVLALEGTITVESSLNGFTKFVVLLPLRAMQPAPLSDLPRLTSGKNTLSLSADYKF